MSDILFCPHEKECGACELLSIPYGKQLERKRHELKELFGNRVGEPPEVVGMDDPIGFRNKIIVPYARERGGRIVFGMYHRGTHRIIPCDGCLVNTRRAISIAGDIARLMPQFKMSPYNEDRHTGWLRHVLIREGFASGEVMVVLVATTDRFQLAKPFVKKLIEKHRDITTVVLNVNNRDTNVVLGTRERNLYGRGWITDSLLGCSFKITSQSFYQTNPVQTERLYKCAIDMAFAGLESDDRLTLFDAYCGIGTIGIIAARERDAHLIGVESSPDAVRCARANARVNGLESARFVEGDAGRYADELARMGARVDIAFMDPPRSGSDERFLTRLARLAPQRVVYISCNPVTQVRDIDRLEKLGYRLNLLKGFDMFPHTNHVETVCLLSKLNAKQHIEINLDMDELDLTDAEKKATYQEIKDYVLEHSGLKVSSLYIAQVKQKCGIIERENYNKPKSEDAKQPQCPPDKEKEIKEALTHFGMI